MKSKYLFEKALKDIYKPFLFFLADHDDFLLSKIPFHPASASINITNKCNSRCIACNMWRNKKENSREELSTAELINILAQLKDEGILRIYLLGGEPLLRSDLPDIIRAASDMGFSNISIVTNGLLLNQEKLKKLVTSGLTEISISIDGKANTNDYCRGIKGSYERNMNNIILIKEEFPGLDIRVLTTLMKPTLSDLIEIINICKQLNVKWFMNLLDISPFFFNNVDISSLKIEDQRQLEEVFKELHKIKRVSNVIDPTLTHVALDYSKNYFTNPKSREIPCIMGFSVIYIGACGEVYSGCWVLKPIGNLRETTLKEIINSREYQKRLQDMFKNKCPGCTCGYQLNLLYHLPSIRDEMLWRIGLKREN